MGAAIHSTARLRDLLISSASRRGALPSTGTGLAVDIVGTTVSFGPTLLVAAVRTGAELKRYAGHVAEPTTARYLRFGTVVTGAVWDAEQAHWNGVGQDMHRHGEVLLTARGSLQPKRLEIRGIGGSPARSSTPTGTTARLVGKRAAVIGTGRNRGQLIPRSPDRRELTSTTHADLGQPKLDFPVRRPSRGVRRAPFTSGCAAGRDRRARGDDGVGVLQ